MVGSDGMIIGTNPALHQILGYPPGSLDGKSIETLVPDAFKQAHVALRKRYADKPQARSMGVGLRLEALRADGSMVPVQIGLAPLGEKPGPVTLAAVRDMSDWVETEQHIAELNLKRMVAEEQDRIARDLHDNVIQDLFALGLTLQGAVGLRAQDLDQRLLKAVGSVDTIINSIRRAIFGVSNDEVLASFRARLVAVISDLTLPLSFDPDIDIVGPVDDLPQALADDMLAVVREGLSNAVRHSGATCIGVTAEVDPQHLTAVIADNGCGIAGERRSGLNNMAERAKRNGGTLEITTGKTIGTTLQWVIPVGLKSR